MLSVGFRGSGVQGVGCRAQGYRGAGSRGQGSRDPGVQGVGCRILGSRHGMTRAKVRLVCDDGGHSLSRALLGQGQRFRV